MTRGGSLAVEAQTVDASVGSYVGAVVGTGRGRVEAVSLFCLLAILTFPINYQFAGSPVRLADIVIAFAAAVWITRVGLRRSTLVLLILALFAVQLVSILWGVTHIGLVTPTNFIFLVKYALPFVTFAILGATVLPSPRVAALMRVNLVVLLLMGIYTYLYLFFLSKGWLPGEFQVGARASFPLTRAGDGLFTGDAHLFGAYLSHGIVLLSCIRRAKIIKMKFGYFFAMVLVLLGAMLLTGSRNGLVSLVATSFFAQGLWILARRQSTRIVPSSLLVVVLFTAAGALALVTAWQDLGLDVAFSDAAQRAVSLGANDQSVSARIFKLMLAVDQVFLEGPFLIGIGYPSTWLTWYDSSIASLIVSGGVLGGVIFVAILIAYIMDLKVIATRNRRLAEYNCILIVLFNYVVANLVTEFFLVTRSVVPVVVALALLGSLVRTPRVVRAEGTAEGRT